MRLGTMSDPQGEFIHSEQRVDTIGHHCGKAWSTHERRGASAG